VEANRANSYSILSVGTGLLQENDAPDNFVLAAENACSASPPAGKLSTRIWGTIF
jgi:hypothetical protein